MSWDCSMVIDTGGERPATITTVRNVTYNNGKIFSALGVHPSSLEGRLGSDVRSLLLVAISESYKPERQEELKSLEPENKWGGLEDSRDFLVKLLAACKEHPSASIHFG